MIQNFSFEKTEIEGLTIVQPFLVSDARGYYMKYYEHNVFEENGIFLTGHEEAQSCSKKGVIRGLHFQTEHPQAKLIRVARGNVFDVVVDLRTDSATFGQWWGTYLSEENKTMLYIPTGFAHGFMALTEDVLLCYISGDDYAPASDGGIRWDDPDIDVHWPMHLIETPILSDKDRNLPLFRESPAFREG